MFLYYRLTAAQKPETCVRYPLDFAHRESSSDALGPLNIFLYKITLLIVLNINVIHKPWRCLQEQRLILDCRYAGHVM